MWLMVQQLTNWNPQQFKGVHGDLGFYGHFYYASVKQSKTLPPSSTTTSYSQPTLSLSIHRCWCCHGYGDCHGVHLLQRHPRIQSVLHVRLLPVSSALVQHHDDHDRCCVRLRPWCHSNTITAQESRANVHFSCHFSEYSHTQAETKGCKEKAEMKTIREHLKYILLFQCWCTKERLR